MHPINEYSCSLGVIIHMNHTDNKSEKKLNISNSNTALSAELLGDLGDVLALEAGDGQLVLGRLARAVGSGECRRSVGRAAGYLFHIDQFLYGIWHADDNHAVM